MARFIEVSAEVMNHGMGLQFMASDLFLNLLIKIDSNPFLEVENGDVKIAWHNISTYVRVWQ